MSRKRSAKSKPALRGIICILPFHTMSTAIFLAVSMALRCRCGEREGFRSCEGPCVCRGHVLVVGRGWCGGIHRETRPVLCVAIYSSRTPKIGLSTTPIAFLVGLQKW
ncbi:hypothetical protein K469DRAFT_218911 [Zopfia rhizophila CBS 207.26]|uniref:Uncharacterized protein n=1 Tax=Zopfia rhizophila CBS 207.26 TaxID=1314779 RepID=A0A6A6DSY0_9PEZI|nr:hypothetical protein K469DRAFT_218911 [Zopfia rhizophila CBS 207.26]